MFMLLIKKVGILGALALAGCTSTQEPPLDYCLEDSIHESMLAEEDKQAMYQRFCEIRGEYNKNYIPNLHDCDDMAQEFRDFLVGIGIAYGRMRLVQGVRKEAGNKKSPGHLWLEVWENRKWKVYDPSQNRFGELPVIMRLEYGIEKVSMGDEIIKDGSYGTGSAGYKNYGDRFENGEWMSGRE